MRNTESKRLGPAARALRQRRKTGWLTSHNPAQKHTAVHRRPGQIDDHFERLVSEHMEQLTTPTAVGDGQAAAWPTPALHPRLVPHSADHILFHCPLLADFRRTILRDSSPHCLFWTVIGAECLALFLLYANVLLRPLPARPDPP